MTFKEKLEIERPGCVSEDYTDRYMGCPYNYGYETKEKSISNCKSNGGKGCEYCWNRKMKNTGVKAEMKKEFDWDKFKNVKNKIAVHCKTEEEANDFCRQMHEHGMEWSIKASYLERNEFEVYKEETTYFSDGTFGDIGYFMKHGFRILEWSDYMSTEKTENMEEQVVQKEQTTQIVKEDLKEQVTQEFTKADLKDGMVVELENEDMYLVLGNKLISENDYHLLNEYDECLKQLKRDRSSYDIQKVFKIITKNIYYLEEIFHSGNIELLWERKEAKEMTVEEMKAKLEELTGEKIEIKY